MCEQLAPAHRAHGVERPGYRAAHRLVTKGGSLEQLARPGGGVVVRTADLLLHHRPLALDFVGLKQRVLQHVREHFDAGCPALEREPVPVAGELACGEGVQPAARTLDGLADLGGGRAPLRALEQHVLHIVRDAVHLGPLEARPDADEEGDGGRLRGRRRRGDYPQPRIERRQLVGGRGGYRGGGRRVGVRLSIRGRIGHRYSASLLLARVARVTSGWSFRLGLPSPRRQATIWGLRPETALGGELRARCR